ncbi:MAG: hypothetical protein FP814_15205 [Desulfobacterium sp.]|nr:hypothetical protein [Desulfobacterium sp.]MBU3950244.1 hypothetical protein [Pseudomonadota bacterium]MBU4035011.1 hypothetical protein [Pseudomonadota bacterium]
MITTIWKFMGNNVAEIIATCALLFTAFQAYCARKHNTLSVKPHLALSVSTTKEADASIFSSKLVNNGLGPAVIKKSNYLFDESHIKNAFETHEYLKNTLKEQEFRLSASVIFEGQHIPAGESIILLEIRVPVNENLNEDDIEDDIKDTLSKFSIGVQYESIYGKKFELG